MRYKVGDRVSLLEYKSFGDFKQTEGNIIKRNGGIFETQLTEYLVELEDNTVTKVRKYNIVGARLPKPRMQVDGYQPSALSAEQLRNIKPPKTGSGIKPTPPPPKIVKGM